MRFPTLLLFAIWLLSVEAGKKKKSASSQSTGLSEISRQSGITSKKASMTPNLLDTRIESSESIRKRMSTEYHEVDKAFRDFCVYFQKFPRQLAPQELGVFTFITHFYCNLLPVLDAQVAEVAAVLEQRVTGTNEAEQAESFHLLLSRAFGVATDIQDFIAKVMEAFPSLSDGSREIKNAAHSIFVIKAKSLKRVMPRQRDIWVQITKDIFSLLEQMRPDTSVIDSTDSLTLTDDIQLTTPAAISHLHDEESNYAPQPQIISAATETVDVGENSMGALSTSSLEVSVDEKDTPLPNTINAVREAFQNAITVRDAMGAFLTSFGKLRTAIGKDPEVISKLDSLLVFPATRAVAWQRFVSEFADFAASLDPRQPSS